MDTLVWALLGYVVYPLWLIVGLLDFALHQRTSIATTAGLGETRLHFAQMLQVAIPVLIVLFLELNLLALALVVAFVVAHTFTAYWDVSYANARREILPLEQVVHAFLITLPLFATTLLVLLHWPTVLGLPDGSSAGVDSLAGLRLRSRPWHPGVIVTVLATSAAFGMLPSLLEYRQVRRAAALTRAAPDLSRERER